MTTWERYFYKKIIGSALLFLFVFYGLYVLIDYSSHLSGAHYHHSMLKPLELILHYLAEFSLRADLLLPFALLIATIHTLTQLNIHSELVSLLASGHSMHRLMRPFLVCGLLVVLLLYANHEWVIPRAAKEMQSLDKKYKVRKEKTSGLIAAHSLRLEDGTHIIYREFDAALKLFYEVYFIPSIDEVWRIGVLNPFEGVPVGEFVDQFNRDTHGNLQPVSSSKSKEFPDLHFQESSLKAILVDLEDLPLSKLYLESPQEKSAEDDEKSARMITALYRKLALPWLALLAVIAPAPFCMRFSRKLNLFLIFAGGIFGLAGLYLFFDAATVLGERQVIAPSIAILLPMALFIFFFMYRFIRMGK
jgi:lipopolysaccharide export system permease protein